MDNFAQKYGDTVFAFGVGFFLINTPDIPTWGAWLTGIFVIMFAVFSLLQFGNQAKFWGLVQRSPESFGPEGKNHESGLFMFDSASKMVSDYEDSVLFWLSLGASVVLMAGLLKHEWYLVLAFEFTASVIGYSFIKAFLKNYHSYYAILNGSGEGNV